jgi:predicted phage tail protein
MTEQSLNSDLKVIKLLGRLGRKFGYQHTLAVKSPAEAIKALSALFAGFRAELSKPGSEYHFITGRKSIGKDELAVYNSSEYILAPATRGSKKGGVLQAILGVVLIIVGAIAFFGYGQTWGTSLMKFGASMLVGGIAQMLAPSPPSMKNEKSENTPNTQFNGAVNTIAQGHRVPIAYGEVMAGSAVISAGISSGFMSSDVEVVGSSTGATVGFSYGGGTGFNDSSQSRQV